MQYVTASGGFRKAGGAVAATAAAAVQGRLPCRGRPGGIFTQSYLLDPPTTAGQYRAQRLLAVLLAFALAVLLAATGF